MRRLVILAMLPLFSATTQVAAQPNCNDAYSMAPNPCGTRWQVSRSVTEGAPIANSVEVPPGGRLVYVSGTVPEAADRAAAEGSPQRYGDTEAQTRSVLRQIAARLQVHGLRPSDIVMMRVFLVAPPGQSRMDFAGMMRAYREMFGAAAGIEVPARSTMQVAGLVDPGWLVEIEVTAAAPPRTVRVR